MVKRLLVPLLLIALMISAIPTASFAQDDVITITHWDQFVTQTPALEQAIAEFEAQHPNIKIERSIQSEVFDLLNLAFQSDTAPAVFQVPQDENFDNWVSSGYLTDLTQFPDFEDLINSYPDPETVINEGSRIAYDGAVYSLPIDAQLPWLQMYVNTAMYKEAGLVNEDGTPALPANWEELINNARVIKEQLGKYGYGFGGADTWSFGWQWWICQFSGPAYSFRGFGWDHQEGQYRAAELPCFQELVNGLLTMRDEGIIPPNAMSLTDEQARAMFADGEIAHFLGGVWIMPGWEQTHPDFTDYTLIPLPPVGQDEPSSKFFANIGGRAWGINANLEGEELAAAWEWFKFIHGQEFGRIWGETGNGLTLQTPGDPAQYGQTPAMAAYLSMVDLTVVQPDIEFRNPNLLQYQQTLIGPNETDILVGLYTGELTDVQAALADLDQRNTEALELAMQDATNAGYEVTLADFIVEDWDAYEDYTEIPEYD